MEMKSSIVNALKSLVPSPHHSHILSLFFQGSKCVSYGNFVHILTNLNLMMKICEISMTELALGACYRLAVWTRLILVLSLRMRLHGAWLHLILKASLGTFL